MLYIDLGDRNGASALLFGDAAQPVVERIRPELAARLKQLVESESPHDQARVASLDAALQSAIRRLRRDGSISLPPRALEDLVRRYV